MDDYSLLGRTTFKYAGSKITGINFNFDFSSSARDQGNKIDIGPYESPYYKTINATNNEALFDLAFPNPVEKANYFTLIFKNELNGNIYINLVDEQGRRIKELMKYFSLSGKQMITLDTSDLRPGLNYIQISKSKENSIIRVIKRNEF